MKVTGEQSQQESDRVPVTFHDVAAYFSEEEWKLLHEWQKELYKTVMKEIHQTLISLGYQIVNPKTLLRIIKGEETYIWDPQDSESREDNVPTSSCCPATSPDMLLRIKREEQLYCSDDHGSKEMEIGNGPCTGDAHVNFDVIKAEREEQLYSKDLEDLEGKDIVDCPSTCDPVITSVFSLSLNHGHGTETHCHEPESERRTAADPIITSVFSLFRQEKACNSQDEVAPDGGTRAGPFITSVFSLKQNEEKTNFQEEPELMERTTGEGTMNRKRKAIECTGGTMSCNASSRKVKMKVVQSSESSTDCRSQLSSECNWEPDGEETAQCESSFSNPIYSNQETFKVERSDEYNQC